jgi:predicted Ser/Thr protein kinase
MEEKEAKKSLEETRELTKGTMPIVIVVDNKEEYDMMTMVKRKMRNVKNIDIEIRDSSSDGGSS